MFTSWKMLGRGGSTDSFYVGHKEWSPRHRTYGEGFIHDWEEAEPRWGRRAGQQDHMYQPDLQEVKAFLTLAEEEVEESDPLEYAP
jgi:hypothetical protein